MTKRKLQSGYGETVKVTRIEFNPGNEGNIIEGRDVPTGIGRVDKVLILERLPDGRLIVDYKVTCG
ncbi:MAG: hypothetical protein R3D63_04605 [Paracoccaceae bacterium]